MATLVGGVVPNANALGTSQRKKGKGAAAVDAQMSQPINLNAQSVTVFDGKRQGKERELLACLVFLSLALLAYAHYL